MRVSFVRSLLLSCVRLCLSIFCMSVCPFHQKHIPVIFDAAFALRLNATGSERWLLQDHLAPEVAQPNLPGNLVYYGARSSAAERQVVLGIFFIHAICLSVVRSVSVGVAWSCSFLLIIFLFYFIFFFSSS